MKLLVDNKIPFFREYLKKIKNHDQFIVKYFDDNNLGNGDCSVSYTHLRAHET